MDLTERVAALERTNRRLMLTLVALGSIVAGAGGGWILRGLRSLCDKHGILLVVDEVQSGMGRTGKMFAVEHAGIEPDILCLAKGVASGLPLGAIVAKAEVMDWPPGSHASTFGGNPVSCRASLATLDLLESEYTANAAHRGEQLRQGLLKMQPQYPELGEVRGSQASIMLHRRPSLHPTGLKSAVSIFPMQSRPRQPSTPSRPISARSMR